MVEDRANRTRVDESAEPPAAPAPGAAIVENGAKALCLAGRTMLDQAGCAMLAQLIQRKMIAASFAGPDSLTTRGIFALDATGVDAIYILYFDHRSMAPVRYSVRRLRRKYPAIPVVVCLWGAAKVKAMSESIGADATVSTLRAAVEFLDAGTHLANAGVAESDHRLRPAAIAQVG